VRRRGGDANHAASTRVPGAVRVWSCSAYFGGVARNAYLKTFEHNTLISSSEVATPDSKWGIPAIAFSSSLSKFAPAAQPAAAAVVQQQTAPSPKWKAPTDIGFQWGGRKWKV
jgi:hypothetical protein